MKSLHAEGDTKCREKEAQLGAEGFSRVEDYDRGSLSERKTANRGRKLDRIEIGSRQDRIG